MPRDIEGTNYFTVAEIADEISVSRQTLWRWRREQKVPPGKRFRDRQVLFDDVEVQAIRDFANRLEPIEGVGADPQRRLF